LAKRNANAGKPHWLLDFTLVTPAGVVKYTEIYPDWGADVWSVVSRSEGVDYVRKEDPWEGVLLHAYPFPELGLWHIEVWFADPPEDSDLGTMRLVWAYTMQETEPAFTATVGEDAHLFQDPYEEVTSDDMNYAMFKVLSDTVLLAKKVNDNEKIARYLPGVELASYGGFVPFQAFGDIEGYPFYFRYRGGRVSLSVALDQDDPVSLPAWGSSIMYSDELGGSLNFHEFCLLFCYLVSRLEKAYYPFKFKVFEAPEESSSPSGYPRTKRGELATHYGITAENAIERMRESDFWKGYVFADEPEYPDHRVYPDPAPIFRVSEEGLAAAEKLVEKDQGWRRGRS